ncbi:MAG: SDR family NAD(P)-dependent oxidoreductase, partial [Candidatus Omnitrophica bacterium]|nr:SDR family NAD(P)-dependent oxidoreductase [Candidatus Omnitrophota bacterium]
MADLKGKVCIVTGASGGIGKVIVKALADQGLKLVLASRRKQLLEEIKSGLPNPEDILCVVCDVTKQADLENLISKTLEKFKRIDVLVNGAGVSSQHPFYNQPLVDIEKII